MTRAPSLLAASAAGLACNRVRRLSNSELAEDERQRAEVRKGGLKQVESDKGRDPKPIRAVVSSQEKTDQDECAGKAAYDNFHLHNDWFQKSDLVEIVSREPFCGFSISGWTFTIRLLVGENRGLLPIGLRRVTKVRLYFPYPIGKQLGRVVI